MNSYHVIGLMSGTSVDGVDLAYCRFLFDGTGWEYQVLYAETYNYPDRWRERLNGLYAASAVDYAQTHVTYGHYLGGLVKQFMQANNLASADAVASHGHTIFHRPGEGFTAQIGEGAALAAACGLPVVCDFRTGDVAYGGQGAPLVPLGDRLLFPNYSHCLNLGGIANISYEENHHRVAYDVCPCNFLLNHYAEKTGQYYDKNGDMARSGKLLPGLLESLSKIAYYDKKPPKSLGREEMENIFIPLIEKNNAAVADVLCTLAEHAAERIAVAAGNEGNLLLTGGGAWNNFLVERIRAHSLCKVTVPDALTVNYKEALIFAFLGVLRLRGEANCLASVTGASRNVSGGALYLP